MDDAQSQSNVSQFNKSMAGFSIMGSVSGASFKQPKFINNAQQNLQAAIDSQKAFERHKKEKERAEAEAREKKKQEKEAKAQQ